MEKGQSLFGALTSLNVLGRLRVQEIFHRLEVDTPLSRLTINICYCMEELITVKRQSITISIY